MPYVTRKVKLYLPEYKQRRLTQWEGLMRSLYNHLLDYWNTYYEQHDRKPNENELRLQLKHWRDHHSYRNDAPATAYQQIIKSLQRSFKNFFDKRANYPKFKSKYGKPTSIPLTNQACVPYDDNHVKLAKLQLVQARSLKDLPDANNSKNKNDPCNSRLKSARLVREGSTWYACLVYDVPVQRCRSQVHTIGLDAGIKSLAVTFDGQEVKEYKLEQDQDVFDKKLRFYNKKLSRQKKTSKRRKRTKSKMQALYKKHVQKRNDQLHKISTEIVKKAETVKIETLDVITMFTDYYSKFNKSLANACISKFLHMIEYKCELYGKELVKCDQYYASSQLCSSCGHKNTYMKNGYYRVLNCKKCGYICDRDENAARNVYAYAGMGCLKASNGLDDMETSGNLSEKCRYHNVSAGALAG